MQTPSLQDTEIQYFIFLQLLDLGICKFIDFITYDLLKIINNSFIFFQKPFQYISLVQGELAINIKKLLRFI